MSAYEIESEGIGAADKGGYMPEPAGVGCSPRARKSTRERVEDVLLLVALIAGLMVAAELGLRRAGW